MLSIHTAIILFVGFLGALAQARPLRRTVTALSSSEIAAFHDPAEYASAAYCSSASVTAWTCGSACSALGKPTKIVTGGDGGLTPRFYIATLSSGSVVVAISGTNTSNALSITVDVDFPLVDVSSTYFPNANNGTLQVHQGFYGAFERIYPTVSAAVKSSGSKQILVTGHSLGGALTLLTATALQRNLGSSCSITAKAFASPRVGNQAWANYVDNTLGNSARHLINYNDDVPHVPPRQWGFVQSSGEIWILADGTTYEYCTGQENSKCSDSLETPLGEVALVASFVSDLDVQQHLGPYAGVTITSETCVD